MDTYLSLSANNKKDPLPDIFVDDGRMDRHLVKMLIESFSNVGDCVFDPFSGFGTTLEVAVECERKAYGVEKDSNKAEYIRDHCKEAVVLNSDIMELTPSAIPDMDLCITSPTYAWKNVGQNPFNLNKNGEYYLEYLSYIEKYFAHISSFMKPNSRIIVEVSNIEWHEVVTPLAWDIARTINSLPCFKLEKELIVNWESDKEGFGGGKYGFGYDHSYCIIFTKK